MKKTVFCPSYVCKASPQEIVDILYEIPKTKSKVKVAVDNDLDIFERYIATDPHDLIGTWVQSLIDKFPNRINKVTLTENPKSLTDEELCITIAKNVTSARSIIVDDREDYSHLQSIIRLADIKLLKRTDAIKIFDKVNEFSYEDFSIDLVAIAHRLTERKNQPAIENTTNDVASDFLRNRGYGGWDQTRSGKSAGGKDAGELDIAERRQNGVIESIIEAFRLGSCGKKNIVVAEHLNKLIHDYDTVGVARSFVLIYAESKNYGSLWKSYLNYIKNLNSCASFHGKHKLINVIDVSDIYSCKANVRAALAVHSRDIANLEVLHIFINMSTD